MNSGKIGADVCTDGRDGTEIEGSIRGPRGSKKEEIDLDKKYKDKQQRRRTEREYEETFQEKNIVWSKMEKEKGKEKIY